MKTDKQMHGGHLWSESIASRPEIETSVSEGLILNSVTRRWEADPLSDPTLSAVKDA